MAKSSAAVLTPPADDDAGLAVGDLGDLLGFHLRMAQTAMYRDFAISLGELGLTQKQYATLSLIGSNPGVSQIAIANRLGTDRATMMAIVDRLEARDLLTRQRSKADRRRQELYLTATGETVLKTARAAIANHESKFTDLFSPAELEAFLSGLRRIHAQG